MSPEKVETDCPITDVRLVYDKDFDAQEFKDYKKAKIESDKDISWGLYYSYKYPNLPIGRFELS